jgi:hypothetical protein
MIRESATKRAESKIGLDSVQSDTDGELVRDGAPLRAPKTRRRPARASSTPADQACLDREVQVAFEKFKAHKSKSKGRRRKFPHTSLQRRMQSGDA